MNMNTITQELNKKISKMSKDDFDDFIERLYKVWYKHHKKEDTAEKARYDEDGKGKGR